MNGNIINLLNVIATHEATVQLRYQVLEMACRHAGLNKLAERYKHEAEESAVHRRKVVDRIYFFDGQVQNLPMVEELLNIKYISTTDLLEALSGDLNAESVAAEKYRNLSDIAEKAKDFGTMSLAMELLKAEEEAIDELKTLLDYRSSVGDAVFILYLS